MEPQPGRSGRGFDTPTGEPCPRNVRSDGSVEGSGACHSCGFCLLLLDAAWPRGAHTGRSTGDALGIAEQQVQRYESTGYRSASLARNSDVAAALDVVVTERVS